MADIWKHLGGFYESSTTTNRCNANAEIFNKTIPTYYTGKKKCIRGEIFRTLLKEILIQIMVQTKMIHQRKQIIMRLQHQK